MSCSSTLSISQYSELRSRKSTMVPRVSETQEEERILELSDYTRTSLKMPSAIDTSNDHENFTGTLTDPALSQSNPSVETSFTEDSHRINEGYDVEGEYFDSEKENDQQPLLNGESERVPEIRLVGGIEVQNELSDTRTILLQSEENETSLSILLQILLPYLIAGFGMVGAGMVLDVVQVSKQF